MRRKITQEREEFELGYEGELPTWSQPYKPLKQPATCEANVRQEQIVVKINK